MYQPWQSDPSMESVIKLIEERERNESKYLRDTRSSASDKWGGIMSIKDMNAPKRHPVQDSPSSHWRGGQEQSGRPQRAESPRRPSGRELGPVAKWGVEIARSLTTQLRLNRRSNSSDDDRASSRNSRCRDSPGKPMSTQVRKRRHSRSVSRSKHGKRSRSRSNSKDRRRNRSVSRKINRIRSNSRERKRYRSNSRDKKRERHSSRDRQRNRSGSRDRKRRRSNSRGKRDRSNSTEKTRGRDSEKKRELSPKSSLALDKSIEVAPALAAAAATNDILSKFVSMIKDVKEQSDNQKTHNNDVLPEFDPVDKANSIVTWLSRVEDIAKLFDWDEKEIQKNALPKLTGDAKVWYLGRKDFIHSWAEWKKKFLEQYPCLDHAQMLEELLNRRSDRNETLEQYFCDKIILVKRCGIRGRQAVECVLHGIQDEPVRLFAAAANFEEPDELLRYLRTAEAIRSTATMTKPAISVTQPPLAAIPTVTDISTPKCSVCHKLGHVAEICYVAKRAANKAAKQCTVCLQYGHSSFKCWNATQPAQNHSQRNWTPLPTNESKKSKKTKVQCLYCGKFGHTENVCRHKNVQQVQKPEPKNTPKCCYKCGQSGHVTKACPLKSLNKSDSITNNDTVPNEDNITLSGAGSSNQPPPPGEE